MIGLFEMLSGKRAFGAEDVSETLATVLRSEPEWDALPAEVDGALRRILRLCLTKDVKLRARDIGDVRLAMEGAFEREASTEASTASSGGWRRVVTAAAASLVIGAALTVTVLQLSTKAPAPALVTRLQLPFSPALPGGDPTSHQMAISPDGRTVAFVGRPEGENDFRIFVRRLDAQAATALPGTTLGFDPVFSPDGNWIAYSTLNELFKVPVNGGRPISLVRLQRVVTDRGLSWAENDWIYYAENMGPEVGDLYRVPASGGEPEKLMREAGNVGWPQPVGDGRFVIFSLEARNTSTWDEGEIMLLDTQTGEQRVLVEAGGASATITATGHLVFVQDGRLLAVPFDRDAMVVRGTPVEVLDGVRYEPASGTSQWTLAENGTLVYLGGGAPATQLKWAGPRGTTQAFAEEQVYYDPRLSPDGRSVAVEALGGGDDIWVLWSVSVGPGKTFEAGIPERLFADLYSNKALTHTGYDVASHGRFLVLGGDSLQTEAMMVIQNWFTELERLVPTP